MTPSVVHDAGHDAVHDAVHAAAPLHRMEVVVGAPEGDGWVRYLDAVDGDRMAGLLTAAATYCGGCPTRTARTAAGTLMIGGVAAALAAPVGAILATQRRGLVCRAADVRLRLGTDGVHGVAMNAPQLLVLPGDPIAGRSGTRTAPDLPTLRRAVAAGYARALNPMLDAAREAVNRGRRALWAEATERLAYSVFAPLRELGRADDAPAEVARLLADAPPQLRHPVRWLPVPLAGVDVPWKARSLCCLAYQTPRWHGQRCATCPLTAPDESVCRIVASLT